MLKFPGIISSILCALPFTAAAENAYSVYVDKDGVMRRDDTHAEVSYYGTNYTVPFAHAYRALGSLGVDRTEAIDRDVYHMSRLGFNAFRLHLWDVEISDADGNLLENEHLDLLDYLIAQLEKRGISVVITAQTNFGNGYPERNIDTGAYTYLYDKCSIHENPEAQAKQARYLDRLSRHVNPYTGRSYANDKSIIALEINNEPCHSGTSKEVTAYINRMVSTLRKSGWKKPVLYNVSHNPDVTDAYYNANINGTTYQWYPTGLVAGHERKGNFLPTVDQYEIPFKDLKGFDKMAKVVYEFDPADILYSHIYPAVARTFRKEGFQWITQFAYDPIDMAWANTEYQTHFLNLAYTPRKAISMKIAAEVAKQTPRGADYGKYPADTVFGNFRVSYKEDLSELNDGKRFFYSNHTSTSPKDVVTLNEIAGVGSSPVITYPGTGAYFLDKLNDDTWRLEVMPDVTLTDDPFEKPSLSRRVGVISHSSHPITISLPSLGTTYYYKGINAGNNLSGMAKEATFTLKPGVYLLSSAQSSLAQIAPHSPYGNILIDEYVAPAADSVPLTLLHTPSAAAVADRPLAIEVEVAGGTGKVDSVVVVPGHVSMWSNHNPTYAMTRKGENQYNLTYFNQSRKNKNVDYFVVVYGEEGPVTFPGGINGTPLDWDFRSAGTYSVPVVQPSSPLILIEPDSDNSNLEMATIPDSWGKIRLDYEKNAPISSDFLTLSGAPETNGQEIILYKRIAELIDAVSPIDNDRLLSLSFDSVAAIDSVKISLVDRDGFTYSHTYPTSEGSVLTLGLNEFALSPTALLPAPYPTFLGRWFYPDTATAPQRPASWDSIAELRISFPGLTAGSDILFRLKGAWIVAPDKAI